MTLELHKDLNLPITELRYGRDIGINTSRQNRLFIKHSCKCCGKERWVLARRGESTVTYCPSCRHIKPEWRDKVKQGIYKFGRDLGYKSTSRRSRLFVNRPCSDCGKKKWTMLSKGIPITTRCTACACIKTHYIDGRTKSQGYVKVRIYKNDKYYPMAKRDYVLEHRLVVAKLLGRCLTPNEMVHHKNGDRTDNRLDNLQIVLRTSHNGIVKCPYCQNTFLIK